MQHVVCDMPCFSLVSIAHCRIARDSAIESVRFGDDDQMIFPHRHRIYHMRSVPSPNRLGPRQVTCRCCSEAQFSTRFKLIIGRLLARS